MELELRLRLEVSRLSEGQRCALYEIFTSAHSEFVETKFAFDDKFLTAHQNGSELAFPRPLPLVKFGHISCGYEEWLQRKYAFPGFVEVEAGDIVVDCGAYVGGFSVSAARRASKVHVFEPEDSNFACLSRNLAGLPNVVLNQLGLYSNSQLIELNISESSVEHSLLAPDDGSLVERRTIEVVALADYCEKKGIERLDFVKIEAEGVELEVFHGLRSLMPEKFAIDVSEERNGTSPADEFKRLLQGRGYDIRQRAHVMFARYR